MMTQTVITEAMRSVVACLALTIKTTMPVIPDGDQAGDGDGAERAAEGARTYVTEIRWPCWAPAPRSCAGRYEMPRRPGTPTG